MKKQVHILNGDALKDQFPKNIDGQIIVARECLVDGTIDGNTLKDFFNNRAEYLSNTYGGTIQDYQKKVVSEFHKILNIDPNSEVNLWFEDDLFCQVNFWFIVNLLHKKGANNPFFLVRPETHSRFGFGALNKSQLELRYKTKLHLRKIDKISSLWEPYKNNDTDVLINIASELSEEYPFIFNAVEAHIERIPRKGNLGRPTESLKMIMKELETKEFSIIFREFNKRESIYGYGDLQVKKLYDEIIDNH